MYTIATKANETGVLASVLGGNKGVESAIAVLKIGISGIARRRTLSETVNFLSKSGTTGVCAPGPRVVVRTGRSDDFVRTLGRTSLYATSKVNIICKTGVLGGPIPYHITNFSLAYGVLRGVGRARSDIFLFNTGPKITRVTTSHVRGECEKLHITNAGSKCFAGRSVPTVVRGVGRSKTGLLLIYLNTNGRRG